MVVCAGLGRNGAVESVSAVQGGFEVLGGLFRVRAMAHEVFSGI